MQQVNDLPTLLNNKEQLANAGCSLLFEQMEDYRVI
jgi:hypothetical protein